MPEKIANTHTLSALEEMYTACVGKTAWHTLYLTGSIPEASRHTLESEPFLQFQHALHAHARCLGAS